jgi:hypothetical protein
VITQSAWRTEIGEQKTRSRVGISQITSGAVLISLCAIVAMILLLTKHEGLAFAAVAAGAFCAFLITAPPFWLALFLIVLIPFEGLITALLGGFDSSARQWFAMWKEVLLGIGIFRVLWHNPTRKEIIASNLWVLIWSGLLMLVYCATFLRLPSVPAIFSLDLETRFLGVMIFFMFLDLDGKRIATLLRAMVWSVGLIALYGLVQYAWDYERLLPLVYHVADLSADGTRRLYSYSLSIFDPAYGAVIAILVLFSGAGRTALRVALPWFALLVPCLVLTYVRSAYLGLLFGIVTVCVFNRAHVRRHAVIVGIAICLICVVLLFGGASVLNSNLGQRLHSIVSQTDGSSMAHKERMEKAVQVISTNPLGIGLGKYGIVQARFAGGVDEAEFTEDWVLQVAVQTGVIGAFAYLGLTGAILVSLLRTRHYWNKDASLLRVSAGAVFVAMTVAGVMIPVWDALLTAVYAWALVGVALADATRPLAGPYLSPTRSWPYRALKAGQQAQLGLLGPTLRSIRKS